MDIRELIRRSASSARIRPEDCLIFSMRSRIYVKVGK